MALYVPPPAPPAQVINIVQDSSMAKTSKVAVAAPVVLVKPPATTSPSMLVETPLIKVLVQKESGGDLNAVGDKGLPEHAYGPLQIRQTVVTDVNAANGTRYTPQQMLGNLPLSIWMFNAYMRIYATPKKLGRPVTDVDRARIWNGGPNGWQEPATVSYGNDAAAKLA